MTRTTPPRWAEAILSVLLDSHDRLTVSGDLLEEYRESIYPARGRRSADRWYLKQVAGFAWRGARLWALLLSGSFIARTAFDWFVPTTDFYLRSSISTAIAIGVLLGAGFWTSWRTTSLRAGTLAGVTTTLIGALISVAGVASLFAIRHDPVTLAAIEGSGGLAEAFTLPVMLLVPGLVLGTLGGLLGAGARHLSRLIA